jgi:hypothetical protein
MPSCDYDSTRSLLPHSPNMPSQYPVNRISGRDGELNCHDGYSILIIWLGSHVWVRLTNLERATVDFCTFRAVSSIQRNW